MLALGLIVGSWKNRIWRGQEDSFYLTLYQQFCSLSYGYLHIFRVCLKTNLRFSLVYGIYLTCFLDGEVSPLRAIPKWQRANDSDIRLASRWYKRPRVPWVVTYIRVWGKKHIGEGLILLEFFLFFFPSWVLSSVGGHRSWVSIFQVSHHIC